MQYIDNTPSARQKFSSVDNRPNKVAGGFTKQSERWDTQGRVRISNPQHPEFNKRGTYREVLSLTVRGTTDVLTSMHHHLFKKVKKEHPIDKGYFKEVLVLSDWGRTKLRTKKYDKLCIRDVK